MKEFKNFCKVLADESAKIINSYFRNDYVVETKADESPVTIADKKGEEVMRELIMKHYPDHGIIGEEFGKHNEDAEYKWILDPIDGTKSFILGTPLFGTLIALTKNEEPVFGVINHSVLRQYLIGDNNSSVLNGEEVTVRECNKIEEAVLLTSEHRLVSDYQDGNKFADLVSRVKIYRGFGDCYGYYLLATGYADIMVDPIMNLWDITAVIPVIKGAGGIISNWQGEPANKSNSSVATGGRIHKEVISILNHS
ncbi:MAG: histidinol-phosphatase [Ignavibacteria bacterium]|jgi:myo-inositol-1(or 4)-monophosphatase